MNRLPALIVASIVLIALAVPAAARERDDPTGGRAEAARRLAAMAAQPAKGIHVKCGDGAVSYTHLTLPTTERV